MSTDDTQPARQPSPYDRSKEPHTVRIDPATYQPPSGSPRAGKPSGWPEQPPQYGGSGSGGQYGSSGQGGSGQGNTPSGYGGAPSGYGSAPAGYGSAPAGYGGSGPSGSGGQFGGSSDTAQYESEPGYGSPAYPGQPGAGVTAPPPGSSRRPRRRRRHRGITMTVFAIIVLLILAVIGDQVGKAVAENQFASQIKSADPQIQPSINIKESLGDPFLKQIATRDLTEVDISASNISVPAGPATLTITSVSAVAKGIHINGSFNGGKVDSITATVFIGYSSLSSALSSQTDGIANLTLSSAGNGLIKASFGVLGANIATETGKITLKGNTVTVAFTGGSGDSTGIGGIIGAVTGGSGGSGGSSTIPTMSFTIPKLPAGVQITGFTVGTQGITINGSAQNQNLSQ
jgi:LmeA-like phospholipid-binding